MGVQPPGLNDPAAGVLSHNQAIGREVVAKQIFAQGEACGARLSSVDLTACAKRTSILGT